MSIADKSTEEVNIQWFLEARGVGLVCDYEQVWGVFGVISA